MKKANYLFEAVHCSRDWTSIELAEFYRVVEILGQAGIGVEFERGMTDEGDPWLVFCRPGSGDVVAHFARIGPQYVVDHPLLGEPLRGAAFADLIDAFIQHFPAAQPRRAGRVGRLWVHPAASLVALVAACTHALTGGC